MIAFISAVWVASFLISIPPLILLGNEHGTNEEPKCEVSQHLGYQLYATLGAFYIPLIVMIFMYYKIYVAARRVVRAEHRARVPALPARRKSFQESRSKIILNNNPTDTGISGVKQIGGTTSDSLLLPIQKSMNTCTECGFYDKDINLDINKGIELFQVSTKESIHPNLEPTEQTQIDPSALSKHDCISELKGPTGIVQDSHSLHFEESSKDRVRSSARSSESDVINLNVTRLQKRKTSSVLRDRKASFTLGNQNLF